MDAFVTVVKSSRTHRDTKPKAPSASTHVTRQNASLSVKVALNVQAPKSRVPPTAAGPSNRALAARQTTQLLTSLKDDSNPITHKSAEARFDYVSSCCTGHERRDGGPQRMPYFESRNQKLAEQEKEKGSYKEDKTGVLRGVRVYLGFCDTNTDIELKREIAQAGGATTYNQSSATHVVTSQWLSGSKTQKLLTGRSKRKVHVVSPQWVSDSIDKGRRQQEWKYSQVESGVQKSVRDGYLSPKKIK